MTDLADWMNRKLIQSRLTGALKVYVGESELSALFENSFVEVGAGGVPIETRRPSLMCRTADIVRAQISKDEIVEGLREPDGSPATYRVLRMEPDEAGMTRILLRR